MLWSAGPRFFFFQGFAGRSNAPTTFDIGVTPIFNRLFFLLSGHVHLFVHFLYFGSGITFWIDQSWPENLGTTCVQHRGTLDSCFDVIRSHQQCIPCSPPLEIKTATTECRTETLPLSHHPHRTQLTPNQLVKVIARRINPNVSCKLQMHSVHWTRSTLLPRLSRRIGNTHPRNYYSHKGKAIYEHFLF